jgi:hypothetical protein
LEEEEPDSFESMAQALGTPRKRAAEIREKESMRGIRWFIEPREKKGTPGRHPDGHFSVLIHATRCPFIPAGKGQKKAGSSPGPGPCFFLRQLSRI